jgi:hypothetical protein
MTSSQPAPSEADFFIAVKSSSGREPHSRPFLLHEIYFHQCLFKPELQRGSSHINSATVAQCMRQSLPDS